jgi:hypothetical protein
MSATLAPNGRSAMPLTNAVCRPVRKRLPKAVRKPPSSLPASWGQSSLDHPDKPGDDEEDGMLAADHLTALARSA